MATHDERIRTLEFKDDRREAHYVELKKDIESLRKGQTEIIQLLGGSSLNGNKGFVKLMELVEDKVDEIEKSIGIHDRDISQGIWWGRAVIVATVGLLIKELFGK